MNPQSLYEILIWLRNKFGLADLSNATITSATTGDILYYNGAAWVNANAATVKTALSLTTANQLSVFAAGTAYSLTNSAALLDFGTTDPSLTLNAAGTYLLLARAHLKYNAATFVANRTTTLKLRRTNNTAADLTSSTYTHTTGILTTATESFIDATWPVLYTTANADDAIAIYGHVDTVPSAGSLDAVDASIVAIRLQQ